jgi:hypothetical protein
MMDSSPPAMTQLTQCFSLGAPIAQKPPTQDVEWFLSMLRIDSREKVNALGCHVDSEANKTDI